MDRRKFLTWATASTAALAVPELWTPKRTFFLPPRSGWQYRADGWWEHNSIITSTGSFLVFGRDTTEMWYDAASKPFLSPRLMSQAIDASRIWYYPPDSVRYSL